MIPTDPIQLLVPTRDMFMPNGEVRVETTTLMPDGSLATLLLRTRGSLFDVSDEAMGRRILATLGIHGSTAGDARRGIEVAEALGVTFTSGCFAVDRIGFEQLPAAIGYVAEACRRWTASTLDARRGRRERDFSDHVVQRLRAAFPDSQIDLERELPGASNKFHRFDVVVALPRDRFALFETVVPAASSMAAAHLKFYDLKQARPDWPREALVEDLAEWTTEDLAMMRQVATGIRGLDTSWHDLERLAA